MNGTHTVSELDDAYFGRYLMAFLKDALRRKVELSAAVAAAEIEYKQDVEQKARNEQWEKDKRRRK